MAKQTGPLFFPISPVFFGFHFLVSLRTISPPCAPIPRLLNSKLTSLYPGPEYWMPQKEYFEVWLSVIQGSNKTVSSTLRFIVQSPANQMTYDKLINRRQILFDINFYMMWGSSQKRSENPKWIGRRTCILIPLFNKEGILGFKGLHHGKINIQGKRMEDEGL